MVKVILLMGILVIGSSLLIWHIRSSKPSAKPPLPIAHIDPSQIVNNFPATVVSTTPQSLTVQTLDTSQPLTKTPPKTIEITLLITPKTKLSIPLEQLKKGDQVSIDTHSPIDPQSQSEALKVDLLPSISTPPSSSSAKPKPSAGVKEL